VRRAGSLEGMRLQGMPPVSLTRSHTRRVAPDDEKTAEDAAVGAVEEASPRRRRGWRGEKGASAADAAGDGAAARIVLAAILAVSPVDTSGDDGGEARNEGGGGLGVSGNAAGASAPAGSNATHDVGVVGGDGSEETWDLCLVIDPVTDDLEAAKTEVEFLFNLFRKEGLTLTDPQPLNPTAGFTGEVLALCTASQDELEEQAEIMGLNKPLKLPTSAQEKFAKGPRYARVTAPFTVARKAQFHEVPYLLRDYQYFS